MWAIAGCLEWQRIGLAPPDVVSAATEEYFRAEDSIELWMNECCVRDKSAMGRHHAIIQILVRMGRRPRRAGGVVQSVLAGSRGERARCAPQSANRAGGFSASASAPNISQQTGWLAKAARMMSHTRVSHGISYGLRC